MEGGNSSDIFSTNISLNGNKTERYWDITYSVVMVTILSISTVLTVVGNFMVIIVVIRYPVMRTRTNLFLMNLAVADFLVGLLLVPSSMSTLIMGTWVLGTIWCTIDGFLNTFLLVTSIHTLMYISIHKCYSLPRSPTDSLKLRQVFFMISATWLWAGFLATITVTGLSHVIYKPRTSQCGPNYPHDLKTYIHHGIIQVTGLIIPLITIVYCYVKMSRIIWYHSRSLQENTTMENTVIFAQQKKIFWTLFIVLACFIVCWLPYHIYASYVSYTSKGQFYGFINPTAYAFGYINSACNPIIYALRSKSFRNGYKEIWCQTKGYFISDESLQDENGSPFGRFSSIFDGSFHRSNNHSNQSGLSSNRADCVQDRECRKASTNSLPSKTRNQRKNFKRHKSLTELMRESPKHHHGSSIIRRNGTIVIMKAGKIVSVREEKNYIDFKRRSSLENPPKIVNGSDKKFVNAAERCEDGFELSTVYSENDMSSDVDEVFEGTVGNEDENCTVTNQTIQRSIIFSRSISQSSPILIDNYDISQLGNSTSDKSAWTYFNPESAITEQCNTTAVINVESFENCSNSEEQSEHAEDEIRLLSIMPLTPHTKYGLAKSDIRLDIEKGVSNVLVVNGNKDLQVKSNSSLNRFFPSLNFQKLLPRSLSEKKLSLQKSPLLQRRLQKKNSFQYLLSPL